VGNSATVTGSWFVFTPGRGFVNYTITMTVNDNV